MSNTLDKTVWREFRYEDGACKEVGGWARIFELADALGAGQAPITTEMVDEAIKESRAARRLAKEALSNPTETGTPDAN